MDLATRKSKQFFFLELKSLDMLTKFILRDFQYFQVLSIFIFYITNFKWWWRTEILHSQKIKSEFFVLIKGTLFWKQIPAEDV